ncbi:MAG: ABC transporter substrate-binding protein [Kiritimatiellae bacterium]|nr:ABC transporter substrate-binding protein [Kiritimatiellia bacterium]
MQSRRLLFALLFLALALGVIAALWTGRLGIARLLGLSRPHAPAVPLAASVQDALGRTIPVPDTRPRRILIAGKAPFAIQDTLMLFPSVRASATLLGRRAAAQREDGAAVQDLLLDAWASPSVRSPSLSLFTEGSAEDIAAADPDLILLKSSSHLFGESLEPLGLPLAYLDLESPDDYARDLLLLGDLLHAPDDAARLAATYAATVADVTTAVSRARAAGAPAPRVLLCQVNASRGPDGCRVPPPDWIQTWLVTAAGGIPCWTNAILPGQWANVTLEQVAAWDPDALVVISYATPATTAVECLATSPAWTSLRCWRTGRVYPMPGDFCSWDLPDPRWLLGLQWMATRLLPPDAFPDFFSMEQALVDFYALLGLSPATTRAKLLPLIPEPL